MPYPLVVLSAAHFPVSVPEGKSPPSGKKVESGIDTTLPLYRSHPEVSEKSRGYSARYKKSGIESVILAWSSLSRCLGLLLTFTWRAQRDFFKDFASFRPKI